MNHEENLTRLIAEANSVLKKAKSNTDDTIKYYYNLSRFFTIINTIKKEILLLETMEYHIPCDIYEEALKLLNTVGDEE